jgi:hypothetical protein
MNYSAFYFEQRNAWMLRLPIPSQDRIQLYQNSDRSKNPHNDSYKPKLRVPAEIIADLLADDADGFLTQLYGQDYKSWLRTFKERLPNHGLEKTLDANDQVNGQLAKFESLLEHSILNRELHSAFIK